MGDASMTGAEIAGQKTFDFECQCKTKMAMTVPEVQFVNQITVSMIVMVHQKVETCPNCGRNYACAISGIDNGLQLTWLEVGKKPSSPIVQPTPEAIKAAEASKGRPNIIKMGG
jgi:hypothetical protein